MIEDSKLNNALFKYFSGIADYQDKILIREWLSISERNKREFEILKSQFSEYKIDFDSDSGKYAQFKSRIEDSKRYGISIPVKPITNHSKRWHKWYYQVAASVLLLLSLTFAIHYFLRHVNANSVSQNSRDQLFTSQTLHGQKLHTQLPDGSEVWLNSGSKISYPTQFSDSIRKVEVVGEVFLDVYHDKSRPFVVFCEGLQAEVIGTSFNVRAYKEEDEKKISLVSGKVRISTFSNISDEKVDKQLFYLTPGYELVYNPKIDNKEKMTFDLHHVTSWKDGALIFDEDDFRNMSTKLERWYGVEIKHVGLPPEDFVVHGEFINENLSNVLEVLKFGRSFSYSLNDNKLLINFNKIDKP